MVGVVWREVVGAVEDEVPMLTRKGGNEWVECREAQPSRAMYLVVLSIEGGLSGWGVILSLVQGGYLLGVENLGGQRYQARLHGRGSEVCD